MTALAQLETLLQARKLDVTLTTSAPWRQRHDERASTSVGSIDAVLDGGLPRGHVSEIVGPRSTGRTTLLCHVMAAGVERGEAVAMVDPCDRFDPVSASGLGLDLQARDPDLRRVDAAVLDLPAGELLREVVRNWTIFSSSESSKETTCHPPVRLLRPLLKDA